MRTFDFEFSRLIRKAIRHIRGLICRKGDQDDNIGQFCTSLRRELRILPDLVDDKYGRQNRNFVKSVCNKRIWADIGVLSTYVPMFYCPNAGQEGIMSKDRLQRCVDYAHVMTDDDEDLDDIAGGLEKLNHQLGVLEMQIKHHEHINQQSEAIAAELLGVMVEISDPYNGATS